jgi:small-conductance mechanosensitive channel
MWVEMVQRRGYDWIAVAPARTEPGTWLRILVVLLIAFALSRVLPRLVRRFVRRTFDARLRDRLAVLRSHAPRALIDSAPIPAVRYTQRSEALGTLYKQLIAGAIWLTAVILILRELHVALATVVTGAGFLGVAVALGAQDLLRDYVAGFFILLDDRFGIGDRVEAGDMVGDVEEVTLRWTRIRDAHGTEWYVPNGRLQEVGNRSQHRGKAVIDVDLPSGLRLADALDRIAKALHDLHDDPDIGRYVLEDPQMLGVETLSREGPTVRLAVHTTAAKQAEVARAVRARIHTCFESGDAEPGGA